MSALDRWLAELFNDEQLDSTCDALADASQASNADEEARLELRHRLKVCNSNLAKYRAALEHNPNIMVVADWIAEVEQERRAIELELGREPTPRKLTKNEIRALVDRLREITAALAAADPEDKRSVYAELGVKLTYQTDGTVLVTASAPQVDACTNECVGGGTPTCFVGFQP